METLGEDRFILLDGDLLICDDEMIQDLLSDRRDNVLGASLQLPRGLGEEEMKFQLEPVDVAWYARRVVGLSKKLDPRASHGESMGMQIVGKDTFSPLLEALRALDADQKKDAYYEDVFADLIRDQAIEFFANAVDPASWIEIDTAEDLSQARTSLQQWQVAAAI
jgi:choline kinase